MNCRDMLFSPRPFRYLPALLPLLWTAVAGAQIQQPPDLRPANFAVKNDQLGFRWDIQANGYFQAGHNNAFSGASVLSLSADGNNFSAFSSNSSSHRLMTADGEEYYLTDTSRGLSGAANPIAVTRRVKFDLKNGVVRFIDLFHNPGPNQLTLWARYNTTLARSPGTTTLTDLGNQQQASGNNVSLETAETGLCVVGSPQNGQVSVLFYLRSRGDRTSLQINNNNNQQLAFTYQFPLPAGQTVALLHGIGQRNLVGPPGKPELTQLFKPFRLSSFTRDIDKTTRQQIINGAIAASFNADDLGGVESLGIQSGTADILAIGEQTRLQGTASCAKLTMDTLYGKVEIPLSEVAGILGPRNSPARQRIFLRDGQIFSGMLQVEDLQFQMNTGLKLELKTENLDRLVFRSEPDDGNPNPDAYAMLQTRTGDRLAVKRNAEQNISAQTPWGPRQIPLDQILQLVPSDEPVGYRLLLRDGTRLFAYLSSEPLRLSTLNFEDREFPPSMLLSLEATFQKSQEDQEPNELALPHLLLTGDNLITGAIEQDALQFVASSQPIPVPPSQIKLLRRAENGEEVGGEPVYVASLWDGGQITGTLREAVLPVRSGGQVIGVPLADIREIHVPSPTVPAATRTRIAELIQELGSAEFKKREAAMKSLAELNHLAKQQLSEAVESSQDAEIRRRAKALLEELD